MFVHLTDYVSNCNVIGEPKPVTGFDEFSISENKNKNIEKKRDGKSTNVVIFCRRIS